MHKTLGPGGEGSIANSSRSMAIITMASALFVFFNATNTEASSVTDDDLMHMSDTKMCSHVTSYGNEFVKASNQPSTPMAWEYLKKSYGDLIRGASDTFLKEYRDRIKEGLICDDAGNVVRYSNVDPNQMGVKKGGVAIDSDGKFVLPGQTPTPACDGQVRLLIRYADAATQWLDRHDATLRTPNAYISHDTVLQKTATIQFSLNDGLSRISTAVTHGDNAEACEGISKFAINAILAPLAGYPADQTVSASEEPGYGVFYGIPEGGAGSGLADAPRSTPHTAVPPSLGSAAPPTIMVSSTFTTTSQIIDIAGRVSSQGRIIALQVDGTDAPLKADGTFSVRRGVPIGDSDFQLAVTDEWGQTSKASVRVKRTVPATAPTAYAPLDPAKTKGTPRPKAVALIIGIDRYQSVPPAEYAENDARSFYDYATNALGVPNDRIKLLVGPDARRLDVRKAIQTWVKPLIDPGQTDIFVFFSGHGLASDGGKDLYLLPYDGDADLLAESAIRRRDLIDAMSESGAASATFFLDTCYSGGTRGRDALVASARPIRIVAKDDGVPSNVTIFTAAGNDQLSSSLAAAKHGLFSYFLMKGLEGDAAGADYNITAAALAAYLAVHIPAEAAKLGRNQTPQLMGSGGTVLSAW